MSEVDTPPALILTVDDDEMTRLLVGATLEREGWRVAFAEEGREGVDAFARLRPDLVLLDINMPKLDGFQCCSAIRALPGGDTVPILLFTGDDSDALIMRAYEAGATDFGAKPTNWKLLAHRVRFLLRWSRLLHPTL